jgi:hypothetical protein
LASFGAVCKLFTLFLNHATEVVCHPGQCLHSVEQTLDRLGIKCGEFLAKADVSSIMENQPATERQLDYLNSFGITQPTGLTKAEASNMIKRSLDDPAARERQNRIRAVEFEKSQREREAFPSYYLKQDLVATERELSAQKRECDKKKEELSQYRRELADVQCRLEKADEIEPTALRQQIASTRELIESIESEVSDQPTEIKEAGLSV